MAAPSPPWTRRVLAFRRPERRTGGLVMHARGRRLAVGSLAALLVSAFGVVGAQLAAQKPTDANASTKLPSKEALIARARRFELNTPYVPPPGDPLEHKTSGYANTMCAAVFITGLDPIVAAENVGFF